MEQHESYKECLSLEEMSDLHESDRFALECHTLARLLQIMTDMFDFCMQHSVATLLQHSCKNCIAV